MNNIIEPNESFDFSQLSLAHPSGIQGGAYFTKIEHNKKPLYIQTPKSLTRQGFIKTGKKYYCDLMFDKNAEPLIHWFENLEEKCQKLIFEKRESWFQNSLEEGDIESAFNSVIRVYKSGKYYLVRTNIKSTRTDEPAVKIYNENEVSLSTNDITPETNIISILEIQGIKFTSRNFQIEIELKQMMVLDNEPIFESCLIKGSKNNVQTKHSSESLEKLSPLENVIIEQSIIEKDDNIVNNVEDNTDKNIDVNISNNLENTLGNDAENNAEKLIVNNDTDSLEAIDIDKIINDYKTNQNDINDDSALDIVAEELNEQTTENYIKELKEFKLNHPLENNETIKLKKPNQVYYELYKEARKKAKEAKKNAIIAYLEAKNIKKTYMIENINDSDSDFDAEIDDISESELEAF